METADSHHAPAVLNHYRASLMNSPLRSCMRNGHPQPPRQAVPTSPEKPQQVLLGQDADHHWPFSITGRQPILFWVIKAGRPLDGSLRRDGDHVFGLDHQVFDLKFDKARAISQMFRPA